MEVNSTYITIAGNFGDFSNKTFSFRVATKSVS